MSTRTLRMGHRRHAVAALAAVVALCWPAQGHACTVTSMLTPVELTQKAALILHVRARGYCTGPREECRQLPQSLAAVNPNAPAMAAPASYSSVGISPAGQITFEVIDVLKGQGLPKTFTIPGKLVEEDDFNDRTPPYTFVRQGGRSGNCFAYGYRQGADYLLFLQPAGEVMTPYWAPLAPINEQVRSGQDPWVNWVRQQVQAK